MRLLGDSTRLRLILLLENEELSVAELQEILAKGQSHISTQLAQLKQAELVEDRRTGKNIFYRLKRGRGAEGKLMVQLLDLLKKVADELPETEQDRKALKFVLKKRHNKTRSYFDNLAGRFGREYLPGRSWEGLAAALLNIMPALVVADLGAGEGAFSQLLAQRAKLVIAIDSSPKMVEFGAKSAHSHGIHNLEYRLGELEEVPVRTATVDVAFFSQSLHHAQRPERAVAEAFRILKPGGRVAILDLLRHQVEEAREMYADVWLGFSEAELDGFLQKNSFRGIRTSVVHREAEPPHFETVLAVAEKPVLKNRSRNRVRPR